MWGWTGSSTCVDPKFYRPAEVDLLVGDPAKAASKLGWQPTVTFTELVHLMAEADLQALQSGQIHTPHIG